MVALWILIVILSLFSATAGALIALRLQYRTMEEGRQERDAWREAQEGRQRTWEVRQAKRNLEVEKQLSNQFKDLRKDWQSWQQDWHELAQQDQQTLQIRADIEQELARLPHIEDIELPLNAHTPRQQPDRWQPPALYQADLRGRDLSHRYMGHADLREAQLTRADLYMTDLTGASLAGANLEGANLAGANLCGANLQGANLHGANLLVADLHNAILQGATLLDARGLTLPQLHTAIYDDTTSIDSTIHTNTAHTPDVHITPEETSLEPQHETEGITEPTENEITLRMPLLSKTESTQQAGQADLTKATPPAHLSKNGQTLTNGLEALDKQESEAHGGTAGVLSSKIIQLLTRSTQADLMSGTKKIDGKKKSDSKISSIARKQG